MQYEHDVMLEIRNIDGVRVDKDTLMIETSFHTPITVARLLKIAAIMVGGLELPERINAQDLILGPIEEAHKNLEKINEYDYPENIPRGSAQVHWECHCGHKWSEIYTHDKVNCPRCGEYMLHKDIELSIRLREVSNEKTKEKVF